MSCEQNIARVAILEQKQTKNSKQLDLKLKIVNKIKENHFKKGKVSIYQKEITIINIYEPNNNIHEAITEKIGEKDRQFNNINWRIQHLDFNNG